MSRQLPPHPNLEHLKKQAKELLPELQQRDSTLKLSDAQHALAREYGFASWPKLKTHVETLSAQARSVALAEKADLFAGPWTANVSKLRQHPANPFQSAILQFEVIGDTVTITDLVIDPSGREERGRNTFLADGTEHPAESRKGYTVMARWQSAYVLEDIVKKAGQVEGRVRYEVSADGKALIVSTDNQVVVVDRR